MKNVPKAENTEVQDRQQNYQVAETKETKEKKNKSSKPAKSPKENNAKKLSVIRGDTQTIKIDFENHEPRNNMMMV